MEYTGTVKDNKGRDIRVENGQIVHWGPANGLHAPFAPGHTAAVRHGAASDRIVKDRVPEIIAQLVAMYPMAMDLPTHIIERWVLVEARLSLMYEYMMKVATGEATIHRERDHECGIECVPPHILSEIAKAEQSSLNYAKTCGMTIESWAGIAKNMGFARHFGTTKVDDLAAEGKRIREAQGRPTVVE